MRNLGGAVLYECPDCGKTREGIEIIISIFFLNYPLSLYMHAVRVIWLHVIFSMMMAFRFWFV